MKKVLVAMLLSFIITSFCACGNDANGSAPTSDTTKEAEPKSETSEDISEPTPAPTPERPSYDIDFGVDDLKIFGTPVSDVLAMSPDEFDTFANSAVTFDENGRAEVEGLEGVYCWLEHKDNEAILLYNFDSVFNVNGFAEVWIKNNESIVELRVKGMDETYDTMAKANIAYISGIDLKEDTTREDIESMLSLEAIKENEKPTEVSAGEYSTWFCDKEIKNKRNGDVYSGFDLALNFPEALQVDAGKNLDYSYSFDSSDNRVKSIKIHLKK